VFLGIEINPRGPTGVLFIFALGRGKPEARGGGFIGKIHVPEAPHWVLPAVGVGGWGSFKLLVSYSPATTIARLYLTYHALTNLA
jgi:hypothetical protein